MKSILRKIKYKIRVNLHKGDKYECPFCNYNARDLSPLGIAHSVIREKEIIGLEKRLGGCYKCGSSDKERLIFAYLKNHTKFLSGGKSFNILHIEPEKELSQLLLRQNFENYICGGLFYKGHTFAPHVINMNVLSIPFGEDIFDLILCNHVLEHIPEDSSVMKEIYRVLKPGGQAIIQVVLSNNLENTFEDFTITGIKEKEMAFGQYNHVRIYAKDYFARLTSAGFSTQRLSIAKDYPKYGLNPKEDLFVATK